MKNLGKVGDMTEEWLPLEKYPGYSASPEGRVRNDARDRILAVVRVPSRRSYIGLMVNKAQVKRSLSRVIAEAFVENPYPEHFKATIHIDGDLTNCRADNLAWRPMWFAQDHTRQFSLNLTDLGPVRNIDTGVVYEGIWSVVFAHGVLFNDVVLSIVNKTYVFPLMQCFEWVDPK